MIETLIQSPENTTNSSFDLGNEAGKSLQNIINSAKNVMVFSPHLDDVALSAGSLVSYLTQHDVNVSVVTLFTEGSEATSKSIQTLLTNAEFSNAKEYFKARKLEDIEALKEIGVKDVRHLDYVDAAWRSDDKGEALYPTGQLAKTQTEKINESDNELIERLKKVVKELVDKLDETMILAPLGRGKHVDHQITRDVVVANFPNAILFQDFPYSALYESEDEYITQHNLIGAEWRGNFDVKKKSILKYETQKKSLFGRGTMILPFEKYFIRSV